MTVQKIKVLMEVWKDMSTGKYQVLNLESGKHSPSDKYGKPPSKFLFYHSGYTHELSGSSLPYENIYSVQPNKFDGYSQFPRPLVKSSFNTPYANTFLKEKIKKLEKIPTPLPHLSLSVIVDRSVNSPKLRKNFKYSIEKFRQDDQTIDQIKSSFNKKPQVEIVTIKELKNKLNFEKINSKPFVPKIYKEERRKLKGFFMKEFVTSGELFEKEKSLTKITNSKYFEKLKRFEMVDRKNLEKRIEQRVKRLD